MVDKSLSMKLLEVNRLNNLNRFINEIKISISMMTVVEFHPPVYVR